MFRMIIIAIRLPQPNFFLAILEQERQRIEQLTAGWDDPTQVDWGPEEGDSQQEEVTVPADSQGPTYKCTALYSYTVNEKI